MTNVVIDVDGDQAYARSSWQLLERDDAGHPVLVAFGRYHDRLVRDGEHWRLAERHAEIDANRRAGPATPST